MQQLIHGGTLVNEGRTFQADILINGQCIQAILPPGTLPPGTPDSIQRLDATNRWIIPGVIDDQVHFREPGLTRKGDIAEGSRAAAAGGVTSFMDMPNVLPPTTTNQLLRERQEIAARHSLVNYSFYLGATADNLPEIHHLDPRTTCGIKVFMGSSTGNLLLNDPLALERLFAEAPILIASHCEDNSIIQANLEKYRRLYGDDIPPACHPLIRNRQACLASSSLAVAIARRHHTRLHILHLSTRDEIDLLDNGPRLQKHVTGEACVHHLWFNDQAYARLGNLVRWNPAIKTEDDRRALLQALHNNRLDVIATDHAPHLLAEKQGSYTRAASGGPLVQHSLPLMLQLMEQGEITLTQIVDHMCHAPADIFRVERRGYLRPGYQADITIIERNPWTVTRDNIRYRCGWSPLEGTTLDYRVHATLVNGNIVYRDGQLDETTRGQLLTFQA